MSLVQVVLRANNTLSALGAFDILIDGVSVTARAGDSQSYTMLGELASALLSLRRGRTTRATAQLCAGKDTWELGLELDGGDVLLSVYRPGPCPEVAVFERRVKLVEFEAAIAEALSATLACDLPRQYRNLLEAAERQLRARPSAAKPLARSLVQDRVLVTTAGGLEVQADASFRVAEQAVLQDGVELERADLHALLLPGRFRLGLGRRSITVPRTHLFLLAERLLWLAEDALESWQAARPLFRRVQVEGVRLGLRRGPGDAPLAISLSNRAESGADKTLTLADVETADFVEGSARFAEALASRYIGHDPRERANLRLQVLLDNARAILGRLAELRLDDGVTNAEPESFRSYGLPSVLPKSDGTWSQGGSMRFVPRWVAAIPSVDLCATVMAGSELIVGSAREIASINTKSGEVTWRVPSERAGTVVCPLGLVRIHSDGRVRMHDLKSGEVRFVAKLQPRTGGGAAGALVNTPGLPKLLLIAEDNASVTALDLASGDIRWRHRAANPSQFRIRRAGRLALIAGSGSSLTALDVLSGETIWRVRDRLPFRGEIAISEDSAYALSSSTVGAARLHHIELWTGRVRFTRTLEEQPTAGQAPILAGRAVIVPTRDHQGVGAIAFDRQTGERLWERPPGMAGGSAAWLGFDDSVIVNSSSGTLLCLDAATGEARYTHVFSRPVEADLARRLEPVVQNGALFVPQHNVQVLRPKTGEIIGQVPADLIPDLLHVDSSCNVFVAEESGHLAAYSVAPSLRLVR